MVELLWNVLGEWLSDGFQFEHTVSKLNNSPGNRPNKLLNMSEPFLPISSSIISIMVAAAVFRSLFSIAFTWFFFTRFLRLFQISELEVLLFALSNENVSVICHFPFHFEIFGSLSCIIITCIFAFTHELPLLFVHVWWRHANILFENFLYNFFLLFLVFLLCFYCSLPIFSDQYDMIRLLRSPSIYVYECWTVKCLTRCHPVY